MQTRILVALLIYLGSYLPLSMILLVQDFTMGSTAQSLCSDWKNFASQCELPLKHPLLALGFFTLCLISLLISLGTIWLATPKRKIIVEECKHVPADLMNYVLPYVVSFMSLDYQETGKFLGFFIFLAWIFWLTYKSGQVILNPALVAFGWGHYEIKYRYEGDSISNTEGCLAKFQPLTGDALRYSSIDKVKILKQRD